MSKFQNISEICDCNVLQLLKNVGNQSKGKKMILVFPEPIAHMSVKTLCMWMTLSVCLKLRASSTLSAGYLDFTFQPEGSLIGLTPQLTDGE